MRDFEDGVDASIEQKLERLEEFKKDLIDKVLKEIKAEYRRMYESLSDCIGSSYANEVFLLEELLKLRNEDKIEAFAAECEKESRMMAADWWDEDLQTYRSGWQWESDFKWLLRDIALGKNDVNPNKTSGKI